MTMYKGKFTGIGLTKKSKTKQNKNNVHELAFHFIQLIQTFHFQIPSLLDLALENLNKIMLICSNILMISKLHCSKSVNT